MSYGKCWCGLDLTRENYGGGNAQGKGKQEVWVCPKHGFDYEQEPAGREG